MRTITLEGLRQEARAQGVSDRRHIAYRCPVCNTIQSADDLINAGAGKTYDDVEIFAGFSCVGRFTGKGPFKSGDGAGAGCDWTLGGLFKIHKLEVAMPDGRKLPIFELATPEEAQAHERKES